MHLTFSYQFHPLGDAAVLIHFDAAASARLSDHILALHHCIRQQPTGFVTDIVPAYNSLTVFYSVLYITPLKQKQETVYAYVCRWLEQLMLSLLQTDLPAIASVIRIPVCYDAAFAPDIETLAHTKQLSIPEVIRQHTSRPYRVYMIGFLPGFPYMGETSETIAMPRKKLPQPVKAGSVGIAGTQTGIYPLDSPGGWQIIGRTPVKMFDPSAPNPVLLKPGDTVQFYSISTNEYTNY